MSLERSAITVLWLIWLSLIIFKPAANEIPSWYGRLIDSGVTRERSLYRDHLPIVMSNGFLFVEADHYAPARIAGRLHFLIDRPSALKYTGTDMFDSKFEKIKSAVNFRANLDDYKTFIKSNAHFFVMAPSADAMDWLLKKLRADGATITLLLQGKGMSLYKIDAG